MSNIKFLALLALSGVLPLCAAEHCDVQGELSAQHENKPCRPRRIVVQDTNPDIDGTGQGHDMTSPTQLLDPASYPGVTSIITSTALNNQLMAVGPGGTVILSAFDEIVIDASSPPVFIPPGNASGTPTTLTLDAPTIVLNQKVVRSAPTAILNGSGAMVNVGPVGGIQNGVDVATSNGTVNLAAAVYDEINFGGNNVDINRLLTLRGQGQDQTIIRPHQGTALIINVQPTNNTGTVTIHDLQVSSEAQQSAGFFAGIYLPPGVYTASLDVHDVTVLATKATAGTMNYGISFNIAPSVSISHCTVKNPLSSIIVNGWCAGSARVTDNTLVGQSIRNSFGIYSSMGSPIDELLIESNHISNCTIGMYVVGTPNQLPNFATVVKKNFIKRTSTSGILDFGLPIVLEENTIEDFAAVDNGFIGQAFGLSLIGSPGSAILRKNKIIATPTPFLNRGANLVTGIVVGGPYSRISMDHDEFTGEFGYYIYNQTPLDLWPSTATVSFNGLVPGHMSRSEYTSVLGKIYDKHNNPSFGAVLDFIPPKAIPKPPSKFTGKVVRKKRASDNKAYVLKMRWRKSRSANVASYRIYANGSFVATVPSSEKLVFKRSQRSEHVHKNYELTAVSTYGVESKKVALSIGKEKAVDRGPQQTILNISAQENHL